MTAPATAAPTVLVIDDEMGILDTIRILLKSEGFTPYTALGGKKGLEQIAALKPELILTDVRMPDVTGLDILASVRAHDPEAVVILMTAQASLQSAIGAVNNGAFYYIQKPFKNEELVTIVRRAAEHRNLRRENKSLKAEAKRKDRTGRPVGSSKAWLESLHVAESVAVTDSTVLLQGESGTGKEVIARYIHDLSVRSEGPFLSINCGALPESLLESELFGHVKGSFTGAIRDKLGLFGAATKGTFFLDEIGETTPATQVKLLRALQHREVIPVGSTDAVAVDTRVVAATNRDLDEEIRVGNFRSDLYYRLNVIALHLPPLRQRRDDIPLLAEHFLQRTAEIRSQPQKRLTDEALAVLLDYTWPGNVRELENALERAIILTPGQDIGSDAWPDRVSERRTEPLVSTRTPPNPTLEAVDRAYSMWVLQSENGNKSRTAEALGIDPSTLYRKLSRYGVEP
jgi:DNA-binding NtrC family response regulator